MRVRCLPNPLKGAGGGTLEGTSARHSFRSRGLDVNLFCDFKAAGFDGAERAHELFNLPLGPAGKRIAAITLLPLAPQEVAG